MKRIITIITLSFLILSGCKKDDTKNVVPNTPVNNDTTVVTPTQPDTSTYRQLNVYDITHYYNQTTGVFKNSIITFSKGGIKITNGITENNVSLTGGPLVYGLGGGLLNGKTLSSRCVVKIGDTITVTGDNSIGQSVGFTVDLRGNKDQILSLTVLSEVKTDTTDKIGVYVIH